MRKVIIYIVCIISFFVFTFCGDNNSKSEIPAKSVSEELLIFHAGSLAVPFREISKAFEAENPNVDVKLEAAGSVTCARKIIDLKRSCDIFASADYKVIDKLLIPEYADWNLEFAGNQMAIVFNENSRYADKINKDNWFDSLLQDDVSFGRANPNSDPCGYRSVLSIKLAEKFYNKPGIADRLLNKDLKFMRPKASDLIALLEVGAIDFMFEYISVAIQQNFKYLQLSDSINLSNSKLENWYKNVSVDISGKKPGEKITFFGEPIIYGATILNDAPNKKLAIDFMKFILSRNKGLEILKKNGQVILNPPVSNQMEKLPQEIKKHIKNN